MTDERDSDSESAYATGTANPVSKLVDAAFGPFTVTVRLTPTDRFLEIVAVRIAKDFRSLSQTIASTGVHDVDDLYEDHKE